MTDSLYFFGGGASTELAPYHFVIMHLYTNTNKWIPLKAPPKVTPYCVTNQGVACGFVVIFPRASQHLIIVQRRGIMGKYIFIRRANYLNFLSVQNFFSHSFSHTTDLGFFVSGHYLHPVTAITRPAQKIFRQAACVLPVWLIAWLGDFISSY